LKECEEYFIQHYPTNNTSSVVVDSQTSFPYLDYYDGLTPNSSSNSLLFFNETPPYGETPTGSLYTEYWETYVELLYNPRTRLFNASAIIPLADYFEMELNDIVQWRGNYYHLRAINDYNLKNGTCKIELLGPIIRDAVQLEPFNCLFNFSSSVAIPTAFYNLQVQAFINNRTVFFTDYNGVSRSFFVNTGAPITNPDRLLNFRFAALSGSVSFSNPLGCTLTTLTQPFTPNFINYSISFGPSVLPTRYYAYQSVDGTIQSGSNYILGPGGCMVSGSFTNTSSNFSLTNNGACTS
jgi:hypothetical protein